MRPPQRAAAPHALDQDARGNELGRQPLEIGFRNLMPGAVCRFRQPLKETLIADGRAIRGHKIKENVGKRLGAVHDGQAGWRIRASYPPTGDWPMP